jgi:hypothetical protein
MLPAIGAMSALSSSGRLGVVVDARPLADQQDGRQLVALQRQTIDRRDAQGQAACRVSGLARVPAEASEKPGSSRRTRALREGRAATAGRRSARLSAAAREAAERLRRRDAQLRQEETGHAAGAGDRAGGPADVQRRGLEGRQDALGGHAGGASGGPAELRRVGAGLAATTTAPPAQDHAAAQLGWRLYAQAGEQAPTRPRLDLTS